MRLDRQSEDEIPFGPTDDERKTLAKPLVIGLLLVAVALVVGVCALALGSRSTPSFSVETSNASNTSENESGNAANSEPLIYVHVVGCVASPGVCALPEGSHLVDAIEAAGGYTEDASTDALNLARVLVDGEQIRVYSVAEAEALAATEPSSSAQSSAGIDASGKVNINYATVDELQTVSGIGEVTAKRIVEDREANGPFGSVDELTRVTGIGEKTLAKMRDSLTV